MQFSQARLWIDDNRLGVVTSQVFNGQRFRPGVNATSPSITRMSVANRHLRLTRTFAFFIAAMRTDSKGSIPEPGGSLQVRFEGLAVHFQEGVEIELFEEAAYRRFQGVG